MQQVMEIREYKPDDIESIIECLSELQDAEYAVESNRKTGLEAAKYYFANIQRKLTEIPGTIFVSENDSAITGLIIVFIQDNQIIEKPGKHIFISDIVVKAEYRGKGLASRLMQLAEEYARSHKISEIRINVLKKNIPALNLYHKLNYHDQEISLTKILNL